MRNLLAGILLATAVPTLDAAAAGQQDEVQGLLPLGSSSPSSVGSASCRQPDPRGYLLPLMFSQQFNNQLITLTENLKLAQKLGRVFVLTGFLEMVVAKEVKTSDGVDFYDAPRQLKPMNDIFNVKETMAQLGRSPEDYIDLDDFKQLCPNLKAEAHAFVPQWEPLIDGGSTSKVNDTWQVTEHLYECDKPLWPKPCNGEGWNNFRNIPVVELKDMLFHGVKQVAHDSQAVLQLSTLPAGSDVPVLVTDGLFYKSNFTTPRYASGPEEILGAINRFRWAPSIMKWAEEFIANKFAFSGGQFIAMHWRRGYTDGTIPIRTMEEVAQLIREKTALLGEVVPIYVASNVFSKTDAAELENLLGSGQKIHSIMLDPPEDTDLNTLSHVEQAICTRAAAFISTPASTWSINVRAYRGEATDSMMSASMLVADLGASVDRKVHVTQLAATAASRAASKASML